MLRILFILGIVNLVTGLFLYFTCRCMPPTRPGKWLMKFNWFQKIFKLHCYIWRGVWLSVAAHAVIGIVYIGWPG
jgi:hypothetical protein